MDAVSGVDDARPPMSQGPRQKLVRVAKNLVSLGLLVAIGVVIARTEGIEQVPRRLRSIHLGAFGLAALLHLGAAATGVVRWRRLLVWQGIDLPLPTLTRIFLVGRFYGAFAPGTTGLDVVRAVEVARLTGETAKSTLAVAVEKVFGLLGLALAAIAMLPLGAARFFGPSAFPMACLAALVSAALVWLVLRPHAMLALARPLPKGIRARLENIAGKLEATPPTLGSVVSMSLLAVLSHSFTAACYAASGLAIDVPATIPELMVVGFAIVVAMLVPISAGGAGVREGTAVILLRTIGVPASEALLVAVLGYLATQPPALLGGLVQLLSKTGRSEAEPRS